MYFAIDIDGTIAGPSPFIVALYCQKLGIAEPGMTYKALLRHPWLSDANFEVALHALRFRREPAKVSELEAL